MIEPVLPARKRLGRPRTTARRKRHERCVWMARKMTEWPSKRGPITKIMPSDGCTGDTVPLAVGRGYDFHEFGWHLGNVGSNLETESHGKCWLDAGLLDSVDGERLARRLSRRAAGRNLVLEPCGIRHRVNPVAARRAAVWRGCLRACSRTGNVSGAGGPARATAGRRSQGKAFCPAGLPTRRRHVDHDARRICAS